MEIEYDSFIYCGMQPSERWKYHIPKQLVHLPQENRMLVQRTISQLHGYGQYPDLVTSQSAFSGLGVPLYIPSAKRWLAESVLSTLRYMPEKHGLIVFLGDVYYSNDLMKIIIESPDDLRFFGETFEIYAIKIPPGNERFHFTERASEVTFMAGKGECKGKLWDIYYMLMGGRPFLEKAYQTTGVFPREDNELFKLKPALDPTCDFDLYEQYEQFLEKNIDPNL